MVSSKYLNFAISQKKLIIYVIRLFLHKVIASKKFFTKLLESFPSNSINFFLSIFCDKRISKVYTYTLHVKCENRAPKHHKSRLKPAINGYFKSLFFSRFLDPFLRKFQIAIPLGGFDSQTPFICINCTRDITYFSYSYIYLYMHFFVFFFLVYIIIIPFIFVFTNVIMVFLHAIKEFCI